MPANSRKPRFAICLAARPEEDLVAGKVYQVIADKSAADAGCLRVVDESGEDYLYPASRFVVAGVPPEQRPRVLRAVKKANKG